MQIMVISIGIYTDLLMKPIPLFPALAGICTGILCQIGLRPPTALGILTLLYVWLAAAIGFCIFFRHQTLLSENGKLSKWESRLTVFSTLFISLVLTVAYAVWPFDSSQVDMLMITSAYNLSWVIERGPHFIVARSDLILFFITAVVTLIPAAVLSILIAFLHMYYVLHRDNTHSKSAIRKIRRSLRILLIQLLAPFFMIAAPMTLMFVSQLCECISFEVVLALFGITAFHPIVHNLVLLGITPTYRAIIVALLRKFRGRALGGVEPLSNISMVPTSQRATQRSATSYFSLFN